MADGPGRPRSEAATMSRRHARIGTGCCSRQQAKRSGQITLAGCQPKPVVA